MQTFKFNLILIFITISQISYSQENSPNFKKNDIYATLGLATNLSYERWVGETKNEKFTFYWRNGLGIWSNWAVGGPQFVTSITALTGQKNSHLEFNGGLTLLYDKQSYDIGVSNANSKPPRSEYLQILPAITIGYRYQKPTGGFLFRAGIGFPEYIYIGLGSSF